MLYCSRLLIGLLALTLVACSGKVSRQVSADLWGTWESFETQIQTDYPDAVPIVLVHGWNGGEFSWPDPRTLMQMEQSLQRDIYLFNYRTGIIANRYPPIELLEEQLDVYLSNYKQVDIVAHSMGTLLIREYLLHHSDNPVRRILFLSGPQFGSNVANLLVELGNISYSGNIQAEELLPGSDFLWSLNSAESAEFEGKLVLNVYARAQENIFKGDMVVSPEHAWLPGAFNAEVDGDHHLGKRIQEPWAMGFLRDGSRPPEAAVPARRELWLRFTLADSDQYLTLSDSNVERFDISHPHKKKSVDFCCENRSGLHTEGGTTLIVEDVTADDAIKVYFHNHTAVQTIRLADLLQQSWPVQLQTITLQEPTPETTQIDSGTP